MVTMDSQVVEDMESPLCTGDLHNKGSGVAMGGQQQSAVFGRQAAAAQTPAQTQPQAPQKALSQQEFDQLWEELNTNF